MNCALQNLAPEEKRVRTVRSLFTRARAPPSSPSSLSKRKVFDLRAAAAAAAAVAATPVSFLPPSLA